MICNKCNVDKELSEFPKPYKKVVKKTCNYCLSKNWKFNILSGLSTLTYNKRKRVGNDEQFEPLYSDITTALLEELKEKQSGKCYWIGVDMDFSSENNLTKPSLDRIDKSKPFTADNVVLACMFANLGRKKNESTNQQMFDLVASIKNLK